MQQDEVGINKGHGHSCQLSAHDRAIDDRARRRFLQMNRCRYCFGSQWFTRTGTCSVFE